MKKLLALFITLCICFSAIPAFAETVIELDSLEYDEYMYEETVVVSGNANVYVLLSLYYPEEFGGDAKFMMTYSPDELREGIEIPLGEQSALWPEGVWTITVQYGEVSESVEFTLSEFVDRTEEPEDDTDDSGNSGTTPSKKPSGNGVTVTSIIPDKTEVTLLAGEKETVNITSSASLTLEIEDKDVISASLSGKTLTITGLKRGTSQIWVKAGSNYASIKVTVKEGSVSSPKDPTEEPTEEPTEVATEEPTEDTEEIVNPFEDIDSHWAKESILALYSKGIINGMSENTFAPDDFVTRAQFVTMLQKAFNLNYTTTSSPFNDVDKDDWYFTYVMAAYDNAVTTGDTENNFNPSSLVTRQDMAVFAHRTMALFGKTEALAPNFTVFSDHDLIKDYAIEPVYSMKQMGIINGMTETTFEPLGNATRAQAAHIIAKLLAL